MEIKGKEINVTAILGKGLVGAIPIVGPLIAEIVGELIANQRLERIESLLTLIESKIASLDTEGLLENLRSEENIDLFEDACHGAARALTQERREYIASLFVNTTTNDQLDYVEAKRLFSLLSELNDAELIILKHQSLRRVGDEWHVFKEQHKNVLMKNEIYALPKQERIDKEAIYASHFSHLVASGLLKHNFQRVKGLPEIDPKTGMQRSKGFVITALGML
ncbi:hypothetical protein FX988_01273 [Paraglaciecola mesophila]|uniref:Uncharacterized protein n=1 Tax=Paraglaciecola mesophila TaxID=197222 RepID=A0A857JJ92_9ALTE|nr:hypothetical protein [Paraglaciecola mesophila]QHJ11051.1 hypothetical protein FX988_01273 [Paraglaciecola mesophila]